MKKNRMNLLMTLAFASALSVGVAFSAMNNVSAKADNEEFCIAGAAVKYVQEGSKENGIRFAVAVEGNESEGGLFKELTSDGAFNSDVTVGGVVAPSDLFTGDLTTETVLSDSQSVAPVTFTYSDFEQGENEEAGYMLAYVTLYNFEAGNYNRDFTVRAYYEVNGEKTYSKPRTASMAEIAKMAIEAGDENADELQEYLKNYKVSFMVDGEEVGWSAVKYGEKIDQAEVPVSEGGEYGWFVDDTYQTRFDFNAEIKGTTQVYGKILTTADLTNGLFTNIEESYTYSNGSLKQAVPVTSENGLATLNVDPGADFYLSMKVAFGHNHATAAQGATGSADNRIGLAYIDPTTSENYRFSFRSTMSAMIYYDKSTQLYDVRSGSAFEEPATGAVTYVYGSTNSTPKDPKLVLQNTAAINNEASKTLTFEYKKMGNEITVWINGEIWTTATIDANFAGVPSILGYALDGKVRNYTYSDIVLVKGAELGGEEEEEKVLFTSMTSDYTETQNGLGETIIKQALPTDNQNGLAYFNVAAGEDFYISFDAELATNVGTATQTWGTGLMAQVGLAYINTTTNENYRYMFRGTLCGLVSYDKSTTLYDTTGETRTAGKNVIYLFGGSNSNPTKNNWSDDKWASMDGDSFKILENKGSSWGINSSNKFNFAFKKVGNQVSVYVNEYLVETYTVEANFQGVPALLAYSLNSTAKNHTYSNFVVKTGAEVNA